MKNENSTSKTDNTGAEEYFNKILNDLNLQGDTALEILKLLCEKGLSERCRKITSEYRTRLAREIDIINRKGLIWGFLVILDIVRFAKSQNLMIYLDCGLLSESLVAYSIGITGIDPVQENLLFERYLNEESKPYTYRIDINVEMGAKSQIIDFISEKYGSEMPELFEMADIQINQFIDMSIVKNTLKKVQQTFGIDIDIYTIDDKDPKVYEMFWDLVSYFDIKDNNFCYKKIGEEEYYQMWKEYLVPLIYRNVNFYYCEITCFDELVAEISLNRPMALQSIEKYEFNKYNPTKIVYECPEVESILSKTYGCILYQEQILQILEKMAGFSPEHSEKCRRALSKKAIEEIKEYRNEFINGNKEEKTVGCISNGISKDVAEKVFDRLIMEAPYTFCKAYATGYSRLLYFMAWLKHYFGSEFQGEIDKWRRPLNTYKKFIFSDENRIVMNAVKEVILNPKYVFNPLFIYGEQGTGKTHLLKKIEKTISKNNPNLSILYITAEDFCYDVLSAIRNRDSWAETRALYRNQDILLIDNLQDLIGKDATLKELSGVIDSLLENKKQIVFAADRPPKSMDISEHMKAQLSGGLIVEIKAPDSSTKQRIILEKAEEYNIRLDKDVVKYLSDNTGSNVSEIQGALINLAAYMKLSAPTVSLKTAKKILNNVLWKNSDYTDEDKKDDN